MRPPHRVLALCGSLRARSINAALLRAASRLAPQGMTVAVFDHLGRLPLFNPDLEADTPEPVQHLHAQVSQAAALLIASPEYAHGVTGTIKNALDWLVSFEDFVHKPVAVWNASPRAHHADDALRETLKTMSADLVEHASITLPLLGAHLDEAGMLASSTVAPAIRDGLLQLQRHLDGEPGPAFGGL
ncbi:NADPH-dependent FMN reductase [Ideonella sp. DXS29W]|uniref:NADPH-dependent FMN reductase n=1 Tax=Ideonella lacteola TaxID=2984193 RepID=A0ABU9BLN3_9BURK